MLICCRTHASIAGYSSTIPTLVVGYSAKSQGIGLDTGMKNWVIPLEEGKKLLGLAMELWEERNKIHQQLKDFEKYAMNQYKQFHIERGAR